MVKGAMLMPNSSSLTTVLASMFASMIFAPASQTSLPIPETKPLYDYQRAGGGVPDARKVYRIVFNLNSAHARSDQADPGLTVIARLLNTYAQYGVTRAHRKFVVVSQGDYVEIMENEFAYRRRHMGRSNPDATLLRRLSKAGVIFVVDRPSLNERGLSNTDIETGVRVHVAANLTFLDLEAQGYVFTSTRSLQNLKP
jgi:intracellular sulfur oxidation DsrE/DsrF family protein